MNPAQTLRHPLTATTGEGRGHDPDFVTHFGGRTAGTNIGWVNDLTRNIYRYRTPTDRRIYTSNT
jgi:hypothetical protein